MIHWIKVKPAVQRQDNLNALSHASLGDLLLSWILLPPWITPIWNSLEQTMTKLIHSSQIMKWISFFSRLKRQVKMQRQYVPLYRLNSEIFQISEVIIGNIVIYVR